MTAQPSIEITDRRQLITHWYNGYKHALARYLFYILGDTGLVEDALHDTFVRALSSVSLKEPPAYPKAWLQRIATNVAYTMLRKQRRQRWFPLTGNEPGRDLERELVLQETVRQCLAQLGKKEAEALLLFEHGGLSCSEIAALSNEQPNAVRVRIFRARERFRRLYERSSNS